MNFSIYLTIISLFSLANCDFPMNVGNWHNDDRFEYWDDIQFEQGDVLVCMLPFGARHVLLASSNTDVIHMVANKNTNIGEIWEESWRKYQDREGRAQSDCYNASNEYNRKFSREDAVRRARKFVGGKRYYSLWHCNCEHYVNYWISNEAKSQQLLGAGTNDKCDIPRHHPD